LWVRNGAEALDFLFRTGAYTGRADSINPRLVLLDAQFAEADALNVLERIRSEPAPGTSRSSCWPHRPTRANWRTAIGSAPQLHRQARRLGPIF